VNQYYVATLAKWILVEAESEEMAREKGEEYFQGTKSAYSSCTFCGKQYSTRLLVENGMNYCRKCGCSKFEPVPMVRTVRFATSDDHELNDMEILQ